MEEETGRSWVWMPWVVLGGLFSLQALGSMGVMSIPPLAPFLKGDWDLGEMQVGLFTSALYAGAAVMSVLAGQLVDRLGVRHILALGQVAIGVLIALLGFTSSLAWALALMFAAGLGYSILNPATAKAIMYWFPQQVRGTAMGIKQMGVTVGSALAAAALPVIAVASSWRVSLQFTGLLVIVSAVIFYILYREPAGPAAALGLEQTGSKKGFRDVIKNKNILMLSLLILPFTAVQLSLGTFLALYLTDSLSFSVVVAGSYLALTQIGGTAGRISWGVVSDILFRGRRKPVLYLIGGISAVMAFALAFTSAFTPAWLLVVIAAAFGFSAIGYNGVYLIYVAEIAGRELAGVATGVSLTISYMGIILGTPFFGYLVEVTGSYQVAWLVMGSIMVVAVALLFLVQEQDRTSQQN